MMLNVDTDLNTIAYRAGFMGTAVVLFSSSHDYLMGTWGPLQPASVAWGVAIGVCALAAAGIALLPRVFPRLVLAILPALIMVILAQAHLQQVNYTPLFWPRTDNEMIAQYSVEALKRGENPYAWNFTDMMRVYRDPGIRITYFLDMSLQNRLTYPIFPSLLMWTFDTIGINQVRTVMLISQVVLMTLLFFGSPKLYRPLILLPLFILKDFTLMGFLGAQDIVWSTLMLGVILAWERFPKLSAVLFGFSAVYRQQPWFAVPFLLVFIWRGPGTQRERLTRIAWFVGIGVAVFLLVNLPFILADPHLWLLGAVEPLYANFNVTGTGLSAMSQYSLIPLPKSPYSLMQFSFLLGATWLHWRHTRAIGQAFWLFPGIVFWFYYRSLGNYWFYWLPPLMLATARGMPYLPNLPAVLTSSRTRWKRTLIPLGLLAAVNLAVWALLLIRLPSIGLRLEAPSGIAPFGSSLVSQLTLAVENNSAEVLTPRFSVQMDRSTEIFSWRILSGPQTLAPGESGEYVITGDYNPTKMFGPRRGAQVVLSDAGGRYELRALATVSMGDDYEHAGAIRNADYRFIVEGANSLDQWTFDTDGQSAALSADPIGDRPVVQLSAQNRLTTPLRLSQTTTLPDTLALWVHPPLGGVRAGLYGLEIIDNEERRLWLLFGLPENVRVDSNRAIIGIPAEPQTWTRLTFDFADLYARAGWEMPPYAFNPVTSRFQRDITLSLLAQPTGGSMFFGAFEQSSPILNPPDIVDALVTQPDIYETYLAETGPQFAPPLPTEEPDHDDTIEN